MKNKLYLIIFAGIFIYNSCYSQCNLSAGISASGSLSFCQGDSVVLTVTTTGDTGSASVLDQSQYVYNGGTSARNLPGYSIMQSFTPSYSGTLDKISMGFFNYINGTGTLDIYSGTGDTGTLLQTQPVSVFCSSGSCLVQFTVSAQVTAGRIYTFDFTPGAGIPDPYGVQVAVPGPYAGGDMIIKDPSGSYFPGFDIVFETYVASGGAHLSYQWQRNGTALQSDTTASITVKDSSGSYNIYVSDNSGCSDTSSSVNVIINQPVYYSFSENICTGDEVNLNGHNYDTTGIYNDTLISSTGCDSIITLHLFVKQPDFTTISASICPGTTYMFKGINLSQPGIYTDTLSNISGCDSVIELHLTASTTPTSILYDSICKGNSYTFGQQTLYSTGVYYDTLATSSCDSVVILNLEVITKPVSFITVLGGDTLTTTIPFATYQWLLDNVAIAGATSQTYVAQLNGSYAVITSNTNGCSDTSAAINLVNVAVSGISLNNSIHLFPNPTTGMLSIQVNDINSKLFDIKIFDEYGRLVSANVASTINGNYSSVINIESLAAGVYYMYFQFNNQCIIKRVELEK